MWPVVARNLDHTECPRPKDGSSLSVADMEVRMSTKVDVDVTELWREFKEHPTTELRNQLVERPQFNRHR